MHFSKVIYKFSLYFLSENFGLADPKLFSLIEPKIEINFTILAYL